MTRRWRAKRLTIWTQNLRGLKSTARLAELFDSFRRRHVFAACVQETWRVDKDDLHDGGCALVSVGLTDAEQSRRGSQGVGVLLSCAGLAAWKKANHEEHRDLGARVMALRLVVRAPDGTEKGLFLVSAYAPIRCSSAGEWEDFFTKLDECCARKHAEDVLLIGLDSNSSVGVRSDVTEDEAANTYSPLGSFGLSHINDSGRRFLKRRTSMRQRPLGFGSAPTGRGYIRDLGCSIKWIILSVSKASANGSLIVVRTDLY